MTQKEFNSTVGEMFGKNFFVELKEYIFDRNYNDYPKLGTLRKLVFNTEANGFKKVIRRIQSRILINVSEFFKWVDETNGII